MTDPVHEIEVMARTIYGEARGEAFQSQVAVAWVIRNRVQRGSQYGGPSYEGVCLKKWQFSCWNPDDPNHDLIKKVSFSSPGYRRAFAVATLVQLGDLPDPTGGATLYYDDSIPPPGWAKSPKVISLGRIDHFFLFKE